MVKTASAAKKPARKAKASKPAAKAKAKAVNGVKLSASQLRRKALAYHSKPRPGKISVEPSKPVRTALDLSLSYTPGVAIPCEEIARDPNLAYKYTARGNLVGIITNGSAVLGLGNIGALASKPVMEGKAMLFKHFAGLDVFDLELDVASPEHFIETVLRLEKTFGAINLEDIAAPACFLIEERLRAEMSIPVMHDDQSGTAVVACAALHNALEIQSKRKCDVKIVCVGAGAAGIGIMRMAREVFGFANEQMHLLDSKGLVTVDRTDLNPYKAQFAKPMTQHTSLADVVKGADVLIGVAKKGMFTKSMLMSMAPNPIIFAMANPDPEVDPRMARRIRPDAVIATGRSDFPNQVNNSVCFPYLFRGALDACANSFTHGMFVAATHAIANLARKKVTPALRKIYPNENLSFGPDYIVPKQNDKRLYASIVPEVRKAYEREVAQSK